MSLSTVGVKSEATGEPGPWPYSLPLTASQIIAVRSVCSERSQHEGLGGPPQ